MNSSPRVNHVIEMRDHFEIRFEREGSALATDTHIARCGIAKDLTKNGGKTITKYVTPEEKQTDLYTLITFITGLKNSLKGIGSADPDESAMRRSCGLLERNCKIL